MEPLADLSTSNHYGSVFGAATAWLVELLAGSSVTILATVAIAILGYSVVIGQGTVRSGGRVVIGCFILLGAASITNGLVDIVESDVQPLPAIESQPVEFPEPVFKPAPQSVNPFDPYSGTNQVKD